MEKIADEAYEFKGTRFHIRAFVDPLRLEKPVFVIEEGKGNDTELAINRVEMAKELAGSLYKNPEEITWLELSADRSLKRFNFEYTHTDTVVPHAGHLSSEDMQAAATGKLNADRVTRYNAHESEASRSEFQAQVGDALEPYETRQNQDFRRMEGPQKKAAYRQENEAELARNPLRDYAPEL